MHVEFCIYNIYSGRNFGFAEVKMVRTVEHVEDEGTPDSSSPLESKGVDQKGNALRSKHSETEQRRRSKINERFQILRDLIPENDQKRDKASFLLEVIQYIQFLHGKLQMYEGSCQAWSTEPTKLSPWVDSKINSGPVESFIDQSHIESLLSGHEDNVVHSPTFLSNAQNSVELDLTGAALQKLTDKLHTTANQCFPQNMPVQPPTFEVVPGQPQQGSFRDAEQFIQQPQSHFWRETSCQDHCSFPINTRNDSELKTENGGASVSSDYSQRLLNSLTDALRSSGVDLSQANITVQLDVGKQRDDRSTAILSDMEDHENLSGFHSVAPMHMSENHEYPNKRLRAGQR